MTLIMPWRVQLLGGLCVSRTDQSVERFRRGTDAELLADLAFHLTDSHPREELVERYWPETDPAAGRLNLRVALSSLRRRLEPPGIPRGSVLLADRTFVCLEQALIMTDVAEFGAAVEATRNDPQRSALWLEEAVRLYTGELLPGYRAEWVGPARDRLRQMFLETLTALAHALRDSGKLDASIESALRMVAADQLHEPAHLLLMGLYAQAGQPLRALNQYAKLRRLLRRELDALPSAAARQLAKDLRTKPQSFRLLPPARESFPQPDITARPAVKEGGMAGDPPVGGVHKATSYLPRPTTRFFGRSGELTTATAMITDGGCRLITFTGPGGSGKTRLALESAALVHAKGGRVAWFVPLADVTDPGLIPEAVLITMGIAPSPAQGLVQQVVAGLSGRKALLVLDNFEHLVEEGGPFVLSLLERVPGLSCLVTSRRHLRLPGEHVVDVPPLPLPEPADTLEQLAGRPSVRLFVDRAQAKAPEFQITERNRQAVKELVRGLEGIPLALEMAAVWVRVHTPARMAAGLKDRYGLLTRNTRGTSERHSTLRKAVAWSYDLLPPETQQFLGCLSAFRGGCSLAAAEAVCQEASADAFLAELQEHSWLTSEEVAGAMRFRMLETLREFAQERLAERGLAGEARAAHLRYFLGLAERAEAGMRGRDQAAWLARLGAEHDNLRAALDHAATDDVPAGRRLAVALWPFWEVRGHWREGQERAEALLRGRAGAGKEMSQDEERAAGGDRAEEEEVRGRLLTNLGALACRRGDHGAAVPYMREALSLWRRRGDADRVGTSLGNLGVAALEQQDYAAAEAYLEEARAVQQTAGDRAGLSRTINNLAILAWRRGDFVGARARYEEALPLKRAAGDLNGLASTLNNLAAMFKDQGDLAGAKPRFEECQLLFERLGSGWQLAYVLCNLGDIAAQEGDEASARAYYTRSLGRLLEHGDRRAAVSCLEGLAALAAVNGRWEEAARLHGCGTRLRAELDMPPTPEERRDREAAQEQARSGLGASGYRVAYEAGQSTSLEAAAGHLCARPEHLLPSEPS